MGGGGHAGLTDCHAHLCDGAFAGDLGEVLARARDAGVEAVIAVGETRADAERNLELAERYPGVVRPTAGLYPTHLDLAEAERVADLIRRERSRLAAIGEVGLDRWKVRDERDLALQREIFALFVDLSIELDLPLNVHSRSAGHYAIDLLRELGARRVQLHAFDGLPAPSRRSKRAARADSKRALLFRAAVDRPLAAEAEARAASTAHVPPARDGQSGARTVAR